MTAWQKLSGPSRGEIASPKKIIIFLHGYGANGDDLIGLYDAYQGLGSDIFFVSPHAPQEISESFMGGRQWFELNQPMSDKQLADGTKDAFPILKRFIDDLKDEYNLQYKDFALIGFSQGAMMALYTALHLSEPIAGVVGFSGRLVDRDALENSVISKPPVFLAHGDMDAVVPFESMLLAQETLDKLKIVNETLRCPAIGHGIPQKAIEKSFEFLKEYF